MSVMSRSGVTIIEMGASESGGARAQGVFAPRRMNPLTAALAVVFGLAMLAVAIVILVPLALVAMLVVGLWLLRAWAREFVARLRGRSAGSGRRNVRVVGPQRRA